MQGETVPAKRFARLSSALRASLGLVLDVALPQLCPTCREPVDGAGLCPACWSKLSFIAPPYCERLGIPFPFDGGPGLLSMEANRVEFAKFCTDEGRESVGSKAKFTAIVSFLFPDAWRLAQSTGSL